MHHSVLTNHFEEFPCLFFNKEANSLWKRLWVLVLWFIWKHRNNVIFNQTKMDAKEILTMAQIQYWAWMKHKVRKVNFSFF